jgi:hypothetical protein
MAGNMKSFLPLGEVVLTIAPKNLSTLFPNFAGIANNSFTVCVQEHETNPPGTLVYIGDGTMVATLANAGRVLSGPLDFNKFENQNSNNSLDMDEFYLAADGAKVRVYLLVG